MTDTNIGLLITNSVIILGGIGQFFWSQVKRIEDRRDAESKRKQDLEDREQDRLDRIQLAQLTLQQLEQVKAQGSDRQKVIVAEVQKTREVAVAAFREANGVNAKIASLGQQLVDNAAPPTAPDPAPAPAA